MEENRRNLFDFGEVVVEEGAPVIALILLLVDRSGAEEEGTGEKLVESFRC